MTASELKTRERLSVLIASRNRPEELERCIESVVDQQFDSIEIIVLDDGSDHPLKESLAEDFDRHGIRWLRNEEPAGVSGARNRLVENAGGSILVFIDDDAHFTNSNSLELVC